MNVSQEERVARRLRARREWIVEEIAKVGGDLKKICNDGELDEGVSASSAARFLARLEEAGSRRIHEIDQALRRIAEGSFGVCERCRGRISPQLLDVTPTIALCAECLRHAAAAAKLG
jgi:RNA polymerase-binding transcription factor DksA